MSIGKHGLVDVKGNTCWKASRSNGSVIVHEIDRLMMFQMQRNMGCIIGDVNAVHVGTDCS